MMTELPLLKFGTINQKFKSNIFFLEMKTRDVFMGVKILILIDGYGLVYGYNNIIDVDTSNTGTKIERNQR